MEIGILRFNEPERDISKKIIHIDMDAFYASVEVRENPSLKGKPVIIAKHPRESGGRGVVATASYEARKYGVHSAMSSMKAYELCPEGIFIPANFELYRSVSSQIHDIFRRYTDLFQPVSLDEAYLDVTSNKVNVPSATLIAKKIQKDIYRETRLTCSAGASYNKFLAKLASDYKKPHGITVIDPEQAHAFLMALPIDKFHGVGKKTVEKMHSLGVYTGKDLYELSENELISRFGKMGLSLYSKVRGIDNSPVNPVRDRKSLGKETTFGENLNNEEQITQALRQLSMKVYSALKDKQVHGKTVVLKIRYDDFETITKRKTFFDYIKDSEQLFSAVYDIWSEEGEAGRGIRLLGVTVTSLDPLLYENIPLPLWREKEGTEYDNETQ